jgi:hypothetical protein
MAMCPELVEGHATRHCALSLSKAATRHCALSSSKGTEPERLAQRVTLPDLMQEAQTLSRFGVPDTTACTR